MAITQVAVYAHPSAADIEALGRDLDEIRQDIEDQLGTRDANYIRRTIAFQRALDATARLTIAVSRCRTCFWRPRSSGASPSTASMSEWARTTSRTDKLTQARALLGKITRQTGKDYVLFQHRVVDVGGAG